MYHRIQAYFAGIQPVWIDGTLYVLLALFGAVELTFNGDDIYKYWLNVKAIYWIKHSLGWIIAGITAVKMFRDKSYADHLKSKALAKEGLKPAPIAPPVVDKNSPVNQPEQTAQQTTTETVENKL